MFKESGTRIDLTRGLTDDPVRRFFGRRAMP